MWQVTLQDVHPDQLISLWPTPDLPLEIVFSLDKERENFAISLYDYVIIYHFTQWFLTFFFVTSTTF